MINIYCDESCHLQHDDSDIMLLGAISCEKSKVKMVSQNIRQIKRNHGLSDKFEIKWTKVSNGQLAFYADLFDYFFSSPDLTFRCVIATGKKELDNDAYHQTYDEWYYKMYYLLLSKMLEPTSQYNVYIDIKDTQGGTKVSKLQTILNNFLYDFHQTCLQRIQIVKSDEIELLQLCDLIMGAICFHNRYLKNYILDGSPAKIKLCKHLQSLSKRSLEDSTPLSETKLNIFVWKPQVIV